MTILTGDCISGLGLVDTIAFVDQLLCDTHLVGLAVDCGRYV